MRLVTFNISSLDGRIAVSPSTPAWLDPRWKPFDAFEPVDVMALHETRVSLQGSNSFASRTADRANFDDHEGHEVPDGDFLPGSLSDHKGRWTLVLDSRARVRWTITQQGGTRIAVLLAATTPRPYKAFLRQSGVPYLEVGAEHVDLRAALRRVEEVFTPSAVVSDAGGILNGALLRAGLVDEVDLQLLPGIVGRATAPAAFEGFDLGGSDRPKLLRTMSAEPRPDGSVFIRYVT